MIENPRITKTLTELLDEAAAPDAARSAFKAGPLRLFHGGWQSWSPGWELEAGETLPRKVRFFPDLYALTAAPWELDSALTSTPQPPKDWVCGSFLFYLRAGDWYLAAAADAAPEGAADFVFALSPDRRTITLESSAYRLFCVKGFFALKDRLAEFFSQGECFRSLEFLGKRPGGYASWYNHYTRINEAIINSDLESLTSRENLIKLWYLDRGKPAVFQIDDGWERAVGDWDYDPLRFPAGMGAAARRIEEAGMIPGLWLAPFLITKKARLFREKSDWLLRSKQGGTSGGLVRAGWNPNWDGVYYCLDITRDDVLRYLEKLMDRVVNEWGFRYLKLDFLYAGFLGGDGAAYEQACRILTANQRRADNAAYSTGAAHPAGTVPTAYLGCGIPLGPSFRHFPLSRIGTDTKEEWDWKAAKLLGHPGRPSALLNLRDTIGRSFMNGTIYINDPDVVFLRTKNCKLNNNEKETVALVNFLLAGQIMISDDAAALTENDRALTRRVAALYDELEGDEYGAVMIMRDVYRLESRSGRAAGTVNLSDRPFTEAGRVTPPRSVRLFKEGRPLN